jgi:hypothetical protein
MEIGVAHIRELLVYRPKKDSGRYQLQLSRLSDKENLESELGSQR